jgi:hypothetical protein
MAPELAGRAIEKKKETYRLIISTASYEREILIYF